MKQWRASAPPNIALIKYMGKTNSQQNLPSNASLSYTLNHLSSTVLLTAIDAKNDQWAQNNGFSETEQQRFIRHLQFLKQRFNYQGAFEITSENSFPAGCGLASSASSYAALTKCALQAFFENQDAQSMAALSRHGSGSSCRSFFDHWVLWREATVEPVHLPYEDLIHQVIVVSQAKKAVSSSEAHQRVIESALFQGRTERAEDRLQHLLKSLKTKDWESAYHITWQEFWDMHALFETCQHPFGYFLPNSLTVLQKIRQDWQDRKDGPLVTMDAGPNVHLLFRSDQKQLAETYKHYFEEDFLVL